MSGIHLLLVGGGSGVVTSLPSSSLSWFTQIHTATAHGSLAVHTDGTLTYSSSSTSGSGSASGPPNWYKPTSAGIGSSYYVRLHVNSGAAPNGGGAVETWIKLTADVSWSWQVLNGTESSNCYLQFSTAGTDASIVATGTVTVDLESTD